MSLTPIYDDVMRELDGIMAASKAKQAQVAADTANAEKAAEQKLDDPLAS
ncbi:hypothetical protein [Umezawaea tangerina]|uniref:Uncharacterized protein n=1 Tax=Umezawaea tangerina TaxID=84725 RepID=A0A2T0SC94_9PSEU|nr:hypothetical protein [Umezawaea tangerina]PRY30943.1 hypothetical protein CLV43_12345 [Umezawaea tangerina]